MMARHGDHQQRDMTSWSDADIKRFFESSKDSVDGHSTFLDFSQLGERCRAWPVPVPFVENFLDATWTLAPAGGSELSVSRVDRSTGEKDLEVNGPGTITLSTYQERFKSACEARDRSVERASQTELHSAAALGVTAVQAYVEYQVEAWNKAHPHEGLDERKILTDEAGHSRTFHVRFEDKIDEWIPTMTGGKGVNKAGKCWQNFSDMVAIRDQIAIHPKRSGYSSTFAALAEDIERFKTGVAGTLLDLHMIFGEKIPRRIIRAYFAPGVEVHEFSQ
jgi:hypothetical protein